MNGACQASSGGAYFYAETFDYIDCMARSLGNAGFVAMARPGSAVALVCTMVFTIAVALLGYRLLLGGRLSTGQLVGLLARSGFVLAATTSWEAYRVLFYDVALVAPEQLVHQIAGSSQATGSNLADRLQQIDGALVALATPRETGDTPADIPMGSPLSPAPAPRQDAAAIAQGQAGQSPVADAAARARLILMVTALGGLGATRLLAGLLLAVGPLFLACLVLAGSRGLFVGWLRVLGGAALGSFGVTMLLWIETATLAPIVQSLLEQAARAPLRNADMVTLTGMLLVMALILLAVLTGTARVMAALRWPERSAATPRAHVVLDSPLLPAATRAAGGRDSRGALPGERPRALEIVSSMERQARRDQGDGPRRIGGAAQVMAAATSPEPARVGHAEQHHGRRTRGRVSAAGDRRDRR